MVNGTVVIWFVFYEGTTAAGIPLNDEKFGMLYGNHIYIVRKKYDGSKKTHSQRNLHAIRM